MARARDTEWVLLVFGDSSARISLVALALLAEGFRADAVARTVRRRL